MLRFKNSKYSCKQMLGYTCPDGENVLVLWAAVARGRVVVACSSWGGQSTALQPAPQRWLCFSAGHGQKKKNAALSYVLMLAKARELRCLLWRNCQLKLTRSHVQLRDVTERGCSFSGWVSKMLVSTGDVPIPRYVLVSIEWWLKRPSFPLQSSADSSQTCALWIFP